MKNLLFLLGILLFSIKGFGCSCKPLGKIDNAQYNSYDLIVKGQIEKLEVKEWTKTIHIRVITEYKGNIKSELISITSPISSASCGIYTKIGETWLFFAKKNKNVYSTSLCTRTKNLSPIAWNYDKEEVESDLAFLEKKIK